MRRDASNARSASIRYVAVWLGALFAFGCSTRGDGAVQSCGGCCMTGCGHSGDCPSGTRCEGTNGRTQCVLPPAGESAASHLRALVDGFAVRRLAMKRLETKDRQYASFELTPDPDFRIVSCALYRCPPEVEITQDEPENRRVIVNYDRCAIAEALFQPAETVLDLSQMTPKEFVGCGAEDGVARTTALLVGCLAYDTANLVAATNLEAVRPEDFPGGLDVARHDCTDLDAGSCVLEDPFAGFGDCHWGHCRPRCLADADCESAIVPVAPDAGVEGVDAGTQPSPVPQCTSEGGGIGVCELGP